MSKTVTIPSSPNPKWECKINEVSYSYLSGSTQEVPDEVANLIEQINASIPQESGKNAPLVPSPSVADAGKAIVVGEDGKYELAEGGGGGGVANLNALFANPPNSVYFISNIEDYIPGQPAMLTIADDQGGGYVEYTTALLGASTSISREVDKTDLTYTHIYYNNALFELPDGTYDTADFGGSFDDMFTVIVDGTYKGYVLLQGSN